MKRSEIYREAARNVCINRPACLLINDVVGSLASNASMMFCEWFAPNRVYRPAWSWQWVGEDPEILPEDEDSFVLDCRTLALLFMACIAEDEERATGKKRSAGRSD